MPGFQSPLRGFFVRKEDFRVNEPPGPYPESIGNRLNQEKVIKGKNRGHSWVALLAPVL